MPKKTSPRFTTHDPPAAGGLRIRSMDDTSWGGTRYYLVRPDTEAYVTAESFLSEQAARDFAARLTIRDALADTMRDMSIGLELEDLAYAAEKLNSRVIATDTLTTEAFLRQAFFPAGPQDPSLIPLARQNMIAALEQVTDEPAPSPAGNDAHLPDDVVDKLGFEELCRIAQRILYVHYPADVKWFSDRDSPDPGPRLTAALRDCLTASSDAESLAHSQPATNSQIKTCDLCSRTGTSGFVVIPGPENPADPTAVAEYTFCSVSAECRRRVDEMFELANGMWPADDA